ncbi:LysM peptidoglycan-binding domain-containing protein [Xylanimonas allomyrinae]|nr:LysM peptidoglycan-binding domain-containing protein [Xylanimonas allomyrinae]
MTVSPAARTFPSAPRGVSMPHGAFGLGGLRLTVRGRVVLIAVAVLVSGAFLGLGGRAFASDPGRPTEVTVHTVAPGETLWGYARQVAAPGEDVRDVVAHLLDLNELSSVALTVGQTILLPAA